MPTPITQPPVPRKGTAPANNPSLVRKATPTSSNEQPEKTVLSEDGQFRTEYYPDRKVLVKVSDGTIVNSKARRQQYSTPEQQALAQQQGVQLTQQDFGKFSTQHSLNGTGVFGNGKDFDWNDFQARHGDWLDQDFQGGFSAFKNAVQDKKWSKTATTWFQRQVNKELQKEGKPVYFKEPGADGMIANDDANYVDGKFGINTFSTPRFYQPPTENKKEVVKPTLGAIPGTPAYDESDSTGGGWWAQDLANFAGAMTDKVNKYNPVLQQERLVIPDYTLLDPSRQLASIKEEASRFSDLAMNTSSGQVARANVLGASGQAATQAANVLGQYENQNVSISNQASAQAAGIRNQETDINTRLLDKFVAESATVNQQYDNAMQARKYRQIDALNQGTTNAQKQNQLEDIMPQVRVDRFNGHLQFSGKGKYLEYDDVYGSGADPTQSLTQQSTYYDKAYGQAFDNAVKRGAKPEDAHKSAAQFATDVLNQYQPTDNRSKSAAKRQMMQAMGGYHLGGEYNPYLPELNY